MNEVPRNIQIALGALIGTVVGLFIFSTVLNTALAQSVSYNDSLNNFFTTQMFSNVWVNNSAELPLTLGLRCPTSQVVSRVRIPMTAIYGGVSGIYVYMNVDGGASTSPRIASIDASPLSGNNSFYFLDYDTFFTCTNTSTTTLYFSASKASTVRLWTPNANTYSNVLKPLVSTKYGAIATNTRFVYFDLFATSTCTATESTSTICDMASTTEAVYAVGYSTNLILGFFLFLIFLFLGYKLVKYFL